MWIKGRTVTLRAIEEADLASLHRWANEPELQRLLGGWHFPNNLREQHAWWQGLNCQSVNQRFAIETAEDGLIGTANLVDIDWKNGTAFQGTLLGDADIRGKGYGTDTVMALMRYAFDELGLARLDTTIIDHNQASLHVYVEKCGWQIEGRQRDWYYREGRRWDRLWVGVTAADYRALIERNEYWK
ncbi:GNAT family N-acetyltransferase [Chitinimonas naiadis]